jgi:hypothetical protein
MRARKLLIYLALFCNFTEAEISYKIYPINNKGKAYGDGYSNVKDFKTARRNILDSEAIIVSVIDNQIREAGEDYETEYCLELGFDGDGNLVSRTRDSLPDLSHIGILGGLGLVAGTVIGGAALIIAGPLGFPVFIAAPIIGSALGGGVNFTNTALGFVSFLYGRQVKLYEKALGTYEDGTKAKEFFLIYNNPNYPQKTITKKEHIPVIIQIVKDTISLWRDFAEENEGTTWGQARGWYLSTIKKKLIKNYGELLDDDDYKKAIKEHIDTLKWEKEVKPGYINKIYSYAVGSQNHTATSKAS